MALRMFSRRETLDADLIIVDEASMCPVGPRKTCGGRPIPAVGDPGQLPPVDKAEHLVPRCSRDRSPTRYSSGITVQRGRSTSNAPPTQPGRAWRCPRTS